MKCDKGFQENILSKLQYDEISLVARNDRIIIAFGEKMYRRKGRVQSRKPFIRQKMRELARFLKEAREECEEVAGLESCLIPSRFPLAVSAVKTLCGFDDVHNVYGNPSLALKLGHSLKKCCSIVRSQALMSGDKELQESSASFRELCESEWREISSVALHTLEGRKHKKPHVLPVTKDVKTVREYLRAERMKCLSAAKSKPTPSSWLSLAKVSLANIVMFNTPPSAQASTIRGSHFQDAKSHSQPDDDIMAAMSPVEKQLVSNFMWIEIIGKRGRKVPVLLTKTMQEEVEELVGTREKVGINVSNIYVFARPYFESEDHIEGHTCLREAAEKSGATHPEDITSTKLRKHLATVSQILNLADHELEQLCGFLGHNIAVHRDFYRLPQDTFQLAKVSRLLIAAEHGQIAKFQGKTLEEIQLDEDLEFCESDVEQGGLSDAEEESTRTEEQPMSPVLEGDPMVTVQESDDEDSDKARPAGRTASQNSTYRPAKRNASGASYRSASRGVVGQKKDYLQPHEKGLILSHFRVHIDRACVPKMAECEAFKTKQPTFLNKRWTKIKETVRNEIEKRKREIKRIQSRR